MNASEVAAAAGAQISEESQQHVYDPPAALAKDAHVKSMAEYAKMYRASIDDPETFFGDMAR